MKTTKEVKQKIRSYILHAIDLSDRDKYKGTQLSERARLNAVYEIFKQEYGHNIKHYGSEQKAFENWLMGLPSCFNIDFENVKILKLCTEWGFLRKNPKEGEERKALNEWWARIYMAFRAMLTAKSPRVKTIDVNALEWFDKVNGNSYFAATVIVNYGKPNEQRFVLPFQYGYGDHYVSQAGRELDDKGIIYLERYPNGNTEGLWQYCDTNKIILRRSKKENCKKAELKNLS
jgi:hypothetical protein